MSRRPPNPAADRAAQNTQTIKTLLKLDANKVCADCKRNKHPRWASWNLGVFICIRCSGIHRGMGTHISRVKSVDLDTWTDEQLQSILSWGNARANKYWEHKLAPGHVPSDPKMENFIRTKYELKRWVMDGPMPNPASLDADGDDDIPLSIVKEKQNIDRKESIRKSVGGGASGSASAEAAARAAARSRAPVVDLIGGNDSFPSPSISSPPPPPRASTAGPPAAQVAPKGVPVPPKATPSANNSSNTRDSLLGLDFLGSPSAAPARPSSTTGSAAGGGQSRPDLKQSILSLYATAPRTQPAQAHHGGGSGSFGSLHSPSLSQGSFGSGGGGIVDAFSNLSFSTAPAPTTSPKPVDAFSGLSSLAGAHNRQGSTTGAKTTSSAFGSLGGGSFFESKPAAPAVTSPSRPAAAASSAFGGMGGFDAFSSTPSLSKATAAAAAATTPAASSNAFGDLFDFSSTSSPPASNAAPAAVSPPAASNSFNSVFNLSAQSAKPTPTAAAPAASPLAAVSANWSNSDVWGGNDGWGASAAPSASAAPAAPTATASYAQHVRPKAPVNDFGWGSPAASTTTNSFATQSIVPGANGGFATAPKVAADEEFGGWTSSTATTTTTATAKPAAGFGGSEDLFSNVWG